MSVPTSQFTPLLPSPLAPVHLFFMDISALEAIVSESSLIVKTHWMIVTT